MIDPEQAKKKVTMMVKASMLLWVIGFLMILVAIYLEFLGPYSAVADSTSSRTLMTLKLGGIGFTLSGIFLSLVAIVKVLAMIPERLGKIIGKK
jgi:hypothetical protein